MVVEWGKKRLAAVKKEFIFMSDKISSAKIY